MTPRTVKVVARRAETLLRYGDYVALDERGRAIACAETKRSVGELVTNFLTRDHRRLLREWKRLEEVPYRILLIELSKAELMRKTALLSDPGRLLDAILRDCREFHLELAFWPPGRQRIQTGELLARWFLRCLETYSARARHAAVRRL
jgi:hypothetical protein